jgi:hypothetical protein
MIETKMNDTPKKPPSLDELGTRYTHYAELRDVFADGVVVMNNALSYHKNAEDLKRRDSLQCAVNEINNRLDNLSGFEGATAYYGALAREINKIPVPAMKQLKGKENELENPEIKPLPPCPKRHPSDHKEPPDYAGTI